MLQAPPETNCGCTLQVATQRVKTAQKSEIPHIDEHVSKIEGVGVQTQSKLLDIKGAAETAGLPTLTAVHNRITTGKLCTVLAQSRRHSLVKHMCCPPCQLCTTGTLQPCLIAIVEPPTSSRSL